MKKILYTIMLLILMYTPIQLSASSVPYESYIKSEGNIRRSSPVYIPVGTIPYDFENPKDLFYSDDTLYVADEDKVIRFDIDGNGFVYSNELMENANGIFVLDGILYVADPDASMVLVFDQNGKLINQYEKPVAPFFGEGTKYAPTNIVISPTNKMYITSEGLTDGIIILNMEGDFLGFYGANESASSIYSFNMMNSGQIGNFFRPTPASVSDIAVDTAGYIYTSTTGLDDSIRKLNVSSSDAYDSNFEYYSTQIFDIWVDQYGNAYTLVNDSDIPSVNVNDVAGNYLFGFSEVTTGSSQLGIFQNPTALTVDDNQKIYVADAGNNQVTVFEPSLVAANIFEGSYLYNSGDLEAANEIWSEFIKFYPDFPMAYDSLGQEAYKNKNYDTALSYFENGTSAEYYSDAKSNIRRLFINEHFQLILLLLILLSIVVYVAKKYVLPKLKVPMVVSQVTEFISFANHVARNPEDGFYQMKYKGKDSYINSIILYVVFFIMLILSFGAKGILFGGVDFADIMVSNLLITYVIMVILILVSQYLVSSIMYGETTMPLLFKSFAYVLVPYIFMSPIIIVLSQVLTLNEEFIIVFLTIM